MSTTITPIMSSAVAFSLSFAPAEPQYQPAVVEVDVERLVSQAPDEGDEDLRRLVRITSDRTGRGVRDRVEQAFEKHGVPVRDEAGAVKIVVTLEWKDYMESHYVVRIVAQRADGTDQTVRLECVLCDEPKLAAAVAEHVPELLPTLEVVDEPPAAVVLPMSEEPEDLSAERSESSLAFPAREGVAAEKPKKVGPLGWVGLSSAVIGVGAMIGGIVALNEGPTVNFQAMDEQVRETTDYRPLGIGVTAAGSVLLGTGAVMLIVDQTVFRRRRERRRAEAALLPFLSPSSGGFALTGRF